MNEAQDVQQETTEASSAENQTSENHETQTDQSGSSDESRVSKTVPYDRFAEVISKNKAFEEKYTALEKELEQIKQQIPQKQVDPGQQQQEQLIRDQIKKMGFVDSKEVEMKLQEIEADRKLQTDLQQLETKYNGQDGRPKFSRIEILEYARDNQIGNLEAAYKLKNHDLLMDYAIKQAQGKVKAVKSESSDGSGSSEAGTTNSDLITAVKKGDKSSLLSFIKRQF